jgi:hypothetical protein
MKPNEAPSFTNLLIDSTNTSGVRRVTTGVRF